MPTNNQSDEARVAVRVTEAENSPEELKTDHMEAILSAAAESHAPSTRKHYRAAWCAFTAWCSAEGYGSLPATPETVAAYFVHRATEGVSPSTLKLASAAIGYFHKEQGLESPTRSAGVGRVLRGLRRRAATSAAAPRRGQARGLTAVHLAAIRATAFLQRKGPSGRTESQKTAFQARSCGCRARLCHARRAPSQVGSGCTHLGRCDVSIRWHGTLTIRRSKTDQEGETAIQFIGRDAAEALKAIRNDADERDRLFGLRSGRAVSNRIAAMARAAGLGDGFSGHSPRIGMAQDLAANGASTTELMGAGRWTGHRMPAHYTKAQAAGRGAVARYYGE